MEKNTSLTPANFSLLRPIILGLGVAFLAIFLSSCGTYPLGDSHYPKYYGGHGSPVSPTGFVPKELRRCDTWLPWF